MKHSLTPFYQPVHSAKGKRVYVSGPMTGYPDSNSAEFAAATETLRAMGYSVCNPVETSDWLGELEHHEFLRFDFERVLEADFLVALKGWEQSQGALAELYMATRMGTKVWYWPTFHDYERISIRRVEKAIAMRHIRNVLEPE